MNHANIVTGFVRVWTGKGCAIDSEGVGAEKQIPHLGDFTYALSTALLIQSKGVH